MGIRNSIFRSINRRQLNPHEFIEQLTNNGGQNMPLINQYNNREQNEILKLLMLGMLSSVQEMVVERDDNQKKICILSEEIIRLERELNKYHVNKENKENINQCILCYDNLQNKKLMCCLQEICHNCYSRLSQCPFCLQNIDNNLE